MSNKPEIKEYLKGFMDKQAFDTLMGILSDINDAQRITRDGRGFWIIGEYMIQSKSFTDAVNIFLRSRDFEKEHLDSKTLKILKAEEGL